MSGKKQKRLEKQLDTSVNKFCCANRFSLLEHYAHGCDMQGSFAKTYKSNQMLHLVFLGPKSSKTIAQIGKSIRIKFTSNLAFKDICFT